MLTTKLVQDIERFKSQPENADFESFSKPGDYFLKQELEYKRDLAARFQDIGTRLLDGNDDDFFRQFINLLSKEKLGSSGHVQNLLNYRDYGAFREVVEKSSENRLSLAKHLREMLEAADNDELIWQRIDEFISCLAKLGLRDAGHTKRWPTFFLFLWRPEKYIFVKPNFFDEMLKSYELEKLGKNNLLDSTRYRRVMLDISEIKTEVSKYLGDTDYLGLQSFLWHVIRTLKSESTTENGFFTNIWLLQPSQDFQIRSKESHLDLDLNGSEDQINSYRKYCSCFQRGDILFYIEPRSRDTVIGEARLQEFELGDSKLRIYTSKLWRVESKVSTKLNERLITPGIVANIDLRTNRGMQFCQEYLDVGRWNFLRAWNPEHFGPIANTVDMSTDEKNINYRIGDRTKLQWKSKACTVGDPVYFLRTTTFPRGIIAKARICDVSQKGEHVGIEFEDVRAGERDPLLYQRELEERLPERQWTPGLILKSDLPDFRSPLRMLWKNVLNRPTNSILYGPPGTGKTYTLRNEYFPKYTGSSTFVSRKEQIRQTLKGMNWREVIAGSILNVGTPQTVPDIVKHEYVQLKAQVNELKAENLWSHVWSVLQLHTPEECGNVNTNFESRSDPRWFWKNEDKSWTVVEDFDSSETGLQVLLSKLDESMNDESTRFKRYDFVTFHQSYSYEEFVEGIRPKLQQDTEQISYELRPGVFRELCDRARTDPSGDRYAIFIDEINRGNISKIFGELITLIEEDKRQGAQNELSVTLPYSRLNFTVPRNLDIYGTMNTADRSLIHVDSALRRRFTFDELMPNSKLLSSVSFKGIDIDLERLLIVMNERIENLFDREHMIGHAYFLADRGKSIQGAELPNIFKNKIIPLLTEYFFDDWSKVRKVLADDDKSEKLQFVRIKRSFENKEVLGLNEEALDEPEAFVRIYK